jgi:hypothetical protein
MHPAIYNDFAAILAGMAQVAGPITLIPKLRMQLGKSEREFGLQQSMADTPDSLVPCKAVKSFERLSHRYLSIRLVGRV